MVAVVKKLILILVLMAVLSGCYDKFYGPKLRNEFPNGIELEVFFSDGVVRESYLPSCDQLFLGEKDRHVEKVLIKIDGNIVFDIDKDKIAEYAKVEGISDGRTVVVVDAKSIRLSTKQECELVEAE